jgi:uncharacterized protein YqjF (DUF2071 family)
MIDRIAPTERPDEVCVGYMRWHDLLFAHWEIPADLLRPLVPRRLSIDTFAGKAYVGLIPFTMTGVRPRGIPPVPGFSVFHETNVRTYVHLEGRDPGVWFFSLDAANLAAVIGARALFHLKYFHARMRFERACGDYRYASQRLAPGPRPATLRAHWKAGEAVGRAAPGTLEHFLCERYVLYAARGEKLYRGRIHHPPYPLQLATLTLLDDTLVARAGVRVEGPPPSVLFSHGPGVDIEVFPIVRVLARWGCAQAALYVALMITRRRAASRCSRARGAAQ